MTLINQVAYSCVAGEYHDEVGLPCQDSIAIQNDEYGCYVALADGAGSIQNSEMISKLVTQTIVEKAKDINLFGMSDEEIIDFVLNTSKETLKDTDLKADCTLIFFAENSENSLLIHVGDGIAIGVKKDVADIISYPENGDYTNQTFFLSGLNNKHIRIARNVDKDYKLIVLSSDGAEHLIYDFHKQEVAPAIAIMQSWFDGTEDVNIINEQLSYAMENLFKTYTDDDMSIALIKR